MEFLVGNYVEFWKAVKWNFGGQLSGILGRQVGGIPDGQVCGFFVGS